MVKGEGLLLRHYIATLYYNITTEEFTTNVKDDNMQTDVFRVVRKFLQRSIQNGFKGVFHGNMRPEPTSSVKCELYGEGYRPGKQLYRCHPFYQKKDQWYDWVVARLPVSRSDSEREQDCRLEEYIPCKLYSLLEIVVDGERLPGPFAVVQRVLVHSSVSQFNGMLSHETYKPSLHFSKSRFDFIQESRSGEKAGWKLPESLMLLGTVIELQFRDEKPYRPFLELIPARNLAKQIFVVQEQVGHLISRPERFQQTLATSYLFDKHDWGVWLQVYRLFNDDDSKRVYEDEDHKASVRKAYLDIRDHLRSQMFDLCDGLWLWYKVYRTVEAKDGKMVMKERVERCEDPRPFPGLLV